MVIVEHSKAFACSLSQSLNERRTAALSRFVRASGLPRPTRSAFCEGMAYHNTSHPGKRVMSHAFCVAPLNYIDFVAIEDRARKAMGRKLHAAWTLRKAERSILPRLPSGEVARLMSERMKADFTDDQVRQAFSKGTGLTDPDTVRAFEDVLRLGHGFLLDDSQTKATPITAHTSTERKDNERRAIRVTVRVERGGSTKVWTINDEDPEQIEVWQHPGEYTTYVKVADGSLSPVADPSQIVKFDRSSDPIKGTMLLIASRADEAKRAIRRYDAELHAYVDPRGVEADLPGYEWRTMGKAINIEAPNGFAFRRPSPFADRGCGARALRRLRPAGRQHPGPREKITGRTPANRRRTSVAP